jgi:hypothetical protein
VDDLVLYQNNFTSIEFPLLANINGFFSLGSTSLVKFSVPNLKYIGGTALLFAIGPNVIFEMLSLQTIGMGLAIVLNEFDTLELPLLETVNGEFRLSGNKQLLITNFLSLSSVHGDMIIASNSQLTGTPMDFPNLAQVKGLFAVVNNSLDLSVPSLSYVGGNFVLDAPFLQFNATSLQYVNGSLNIVGGLEDVDLPSLYYVGGDFVVADTLTISNINLPLLFSVGGGFITINNQELTTINAPLLDTIGSAVAIQDGFFMRTVNFSGLRNVCAYDFGETLNILQPDPLYYFCPSLLNTGYCFGFPALKINSTCMP